MNNVFEGMIWFFLPVSLVICNDIFAYLCGITFGRTQLIKLSPKKTVEGFVGAWILTVIFGVGMTNVLMRYDYFICPVNVSKASTFMLCIYLQESRILAPMFGQACSVPQPRFPSSYLLSPDLVPVRKQLQDCTHAIPYPRLCDLCISHCTVWWILCVWTQAHVQAQRLRRFHPGPWRYHRSHGLPIHHGILCIHVLPQLHCCVQGISWRSNRDRHHGLNARRANGACKGHQQASTQPRNPL